MHPLKSWGETFPDPPSSPARHTETLLTNRLQVVKAGDVEAGGWVSGFARVVHLEVVVDDLIHATNLVGSLPLFYGFSPAIKSIHVKFTVLMSSWFFDFILSFPLLGDLTVVTHYKPLADNPDALPTATCPTHDLVF